MANFAFIGGAYEAPSIYQDGQQLINWFCEVDKEKQEIGEARGAVALYPTPGYTLKVTPGPIAEVRALHTITGGTLLLAVVGNILYSINSAFVATSVGTLSSSGGLVYIDDNGTSAYIVDGSNRYYYTWGTNTFAQISHTDGPFIGGGTVTTVDNYFVYNQPNSNFWAASDALSTTTQALSVGQKFGGPDHIVSLEVNGRNVWLFGEKTTEVWIEVGSFPFPFQIIPGTNSQYGCAAANSICRLVDGIALLSQNSRGQGIVMMTNGFSLQRISTHAVEQSLLGQKISDAQAFTYQIEGHEMYVLTFPTADFTWVFDVSTQKWHKWLSIDNFGVYHRHRANCYEIFQGVNLIGDYQNGNIYAISNSVYTDNGNAIRRVRRCTHLTADLKRLYLDQLQIQFQPGVGNASGNGVDPQAMLRWSDDGGSTWSNEHWHTIGKLGIYKNRCIWRRMGYARDRVYEVVVSDPINATIISADLTASAGDS